ncbi:hypothetical protein [Candidatus Williamhamiltonella defendens]|nr:hypothetical protein [Candidatus Hamiltonella defensa]
MVISRAIAKIRFPVRVQLISVMHPSPSRYYKIFIIE